MATTNNETAGSIGQERGQASPNEIDLRKLAQKLYELLREKLEIENERTGHSR